MLQDLRPFYLTVLEEQLRIESYTAVNLDLRRFAMLKANLRWMLVCLRKEQC